MLATYYNHDYLLDIKYLLCNLRKTIDANIMKLLFVFVHTLLFLISHVGRVSALCLLRDYLNLHDESWK